MDDEQVVAVRLLLDRLRDLEEAQERHNKLIEDYLEFIADKERSRASDAEWIKELFTKVFWQLHTLRTDLLMITGAFMIFELLMAWGKVL